MPEQDKTAKPWRAILSPEAYRVTRESGTERPFSGEYVVLFDKGHYHCVCCGALLFQSDSKFATSCGWPSFFQAADSKALLLLEDHTHGMVRVEVRCAVCDAHLGHVFPDGPQPTGERYCINSVALIFKPAA